MFLIINGDLTQWQEMSLGKLQLEFTLGGLTLFLTCPSMPPTTIPAFLSYPVGISSPKQDPNKKG